MTPSETIGLVWRCDDCGRSQLSEARRGEGSDPNIDPEFGLFTIRIICADCGRKRMESA